MHRIAVCILLTCCAAITAGETERPIDLAAERLRHEAKSGWSDEAGHARTSSDFTDRCEINLSSDAVIDALGRRLDDNAAIDGYVKWQLLSCIDDLSAASPKQIGRMVRAMPAVLGQPQFDIRSAGGTASSGGGVSVSGTGMFTVRASLATLEDMQRFPVHAVTNDGQIVTGFIQQPIMNLMQVKTTVAAPAGAAAAGVDRRVEHPAGRANELLGQLTRIVSQANRPALAYRDALIERLPRERGMRLAAAIKDLRDRIEAGDPSTHDAVQRLVAESQELNQTGVGRGPRKQLAARLNELQSVRLLALHLE